MSDNIPFEIQVEIMNRLPVKSLLHFHSVSKSWKCMIDSSSFIFTYGVRFGVPPDTLDPTIVKISYPVSGQGVVGGLIYWLGHERSVSNSGVFNKKMLLVSFDMNTHKFEVIDIPDIIIRPLGFSLTISNIQNSLLLSGNVFPPDNFIFAGQLLSIHDGSITLFTVIYTIPSSYFTKLMGFNNQDEPTVEAAMCHCKGHSVQVYNPKSDLFNNVTQILGNAGSFYVGPYKESMILPTYPDHSHYCAGYSLCFVKRIKQKCVKDVVIVYSPGYFVVN
ncbi:F-box domain containing protein [Tanacetum coccineum]